MLNSSDMLDSIISISIATVAIVLLVNVTSCVQENYKQKTNALTACVTAGGSWLVHPTAAYGPIGCVMGGDK